MFADSVPLSDMPACTVQLCQTRMLGSFIQIHVFVKCLIRREIWYVLKPPDMPTGKQQLPRVCKTYQLPSWTLSWIYQTLSDALAASLWFYKDDVCNSGIRKNQHSTCKSLEFASLGENFLIFFVINCHFGGHFAKILILFLYYCYESSIFN